MTAHLTTAFLFCIAASTVAIAFRKSELNEVYIGGTLYQVTIDGNGDAKFRVASAPLLKAVSAVNACTGNAGPCTVINYTNSRSNWPRPDVSTGESRIARFDILDNALAEFWVSACVVEVVVDAAMFKPGLSEVGVQRIDSYAPLGEPVPDMRFFVGTRQRGQFSVMRDEATGPVSCASRIKLSIKIVN